MTSSESGGSDKETPVRETPAAGAQATADTRSRKSRKKSSNKSPLTDSVALEQLISELRERQQLLQTIASVPPPPPPPLQPPTPPPPPPATTKPAAVKQALKKSSTAPVAPKGLSKTRKDQLRRLNGLKKVLDKAVTSYNDLAASLENTLSE